MIRQINTRLTLYQAGNPIRSLPGVLTNSPGGTQAAITASVSSATLRSCSFEVVDPSGALIPGRGSALEPTGNEILVEYGVDGPSGWEWTTVGQFGIAAAEVVDSVATSIEDGPVVAISGQDRGFVLSALTSDTQVVTAGTPMEVAIYRLLSGAAPWIPASAFQLPTTGIQLPSQILDVGTNPLTTAQGWASAAGWRLYVSAPGNIILTPVAVGAVPDRRYAGPGGQGAHGVVSEVDQPWDATSACNGITVIGSYPGQIPVRATVWDADPSSPTYYLGPFGKRPAAPQTLDTVSTVAQAQAAAQALLPTILGLSRPLTLTMIPDPTLIEYMVIAADFPADGIVGEYQVQSWMLPLDTTQEATVTAIPTGLYGQAPS